MMQTTSKRYAADLFCGAGGFSSGLLAATKTLGLDVELLAINHWTVAIETHSLNHPGVRHMCQSLDAINPREAVPGGKLHLLLASPECTHFSTARGGKPMSDQSRSSAWCILRWLDALDVENVLIENVPEFQTWGPLYPADYRVEKLRNRPIPSRKGLFFRNFIRNLRTLGYRVDYRTLVAADYGDATTRKRLFIIARKGRKPIVWPEPTHTREPETKQRTFAFHRSTRRWRPAREVIDWSIRGESIYGRKRPLAPNTLARIFAGLQRFSGLPFVLGQQSCSAPRSTEDPIPTVAGAGAISLVEPFLVVLRNHCDAVGLDDPVPTIAANGQHIALAEPYVVVNRAHGSGPNGSSHSLDEPIRSLTTGDNMALAEPFLVAVNHGPDTRRIAGLDQPFPTLTGKGTQALIEPYLVNLKGQSTASDVDRPAPTITAHAPHLYLAEPYLMNITHQGGNGNHVYPVEQPAPTVTTKAELALVEPYLVEFYGEREGQSPRCRSLDAPFPTVAGTRTHGLCEPFLVEYYGNGQAHSVEDPIPTVTTRDRLALVHPELVRAGQVDGQVIGWLDIRFRMLQPHELAAAMSFPRSYRFSGTREQQVKQIGNAVPVRTAQALCEMLLGG